LNSQGRIQGGGIAVLRTKPGQNTWDYPPLAEKKLTLPDEASPLPPELKIAGWIRPMRITYKNSTY
jgi:hypothetical protein